MPTIRYCTTPAGRIAYSKAGAGPALLCESGWVTHLRGQLELFSFSSFVERLAERFTVIRYDKPGCGLSDRDGNAGQHTVMARPWFKRRWTSIGPAPAERATFVLCANLVLALLFWLWRPIRGTLWSLSGPGGDALWAG